MLALLICGVLLFAAALSAPRLLSGPTLYDRALALKTIGVKLALACAAIAVALKDSAPTDVAVAMGFGLLVVLVAVVKLFRQRSFQPPLSVPGEL